MKAIKYFTDRIENNRKAHSVIKKESGYEKI